MFKVKKGISMLLVLVMMLVGGTQVFANDDPIVTTPGESGETYLEAVFEATSIHALIPFKIIVEMLENGQVVTAEVGTYRITNLGTIGQLVVEDVELIEVGSWELVEFSSDFANMSKHETKFGFMINNEAIDPITKRPALLEENWGLIKPSESLIIIPDARFSFRANSSTENIGRVRFTIGVF